MPLWPLNTGAKGTIERNEHEHTDSELVGSTRARTGDLVSGASRDSI